MAAEAWASLPPIRVGPAVRLAGGAMHRLWAGSNVLLAGHAALQNGRKPGLKEAAASA